MPNTYKTPGVYIQEGNQFPTSIVPVNTCMPVFIGYTETNARHMLPTPIGSLAEYRRQFGWAQPETDVIVTIDTILDSHGHQQLTNLGATMKPKPAQSNAIQPNAVGLNGVTGAGPSSSHILAYAMELFFANGGGSCYVVSVGPYAAAPGTIRLTDLMLGLTAAAAESGITLIVFPEAQGLSIADFATLHNAALQQSAELQDRFVIMDVHGGNASPADSRTDPHAMIETFRSYGIGADNLKYGAAYAPSIETSLELALDETNVEVRLTADGVVKADAPRTLVELKVHDVNLYNFAKARTRVVPCVLPPSAAIAGLYNQIDNTFGVWHAPANTGFAAVKKPVLPIDDTLQDEMTTGVSGKSINAIREFAGRGTLVWGARTLDGNSTDWRYLSVRRFMTFVETSLRVGTAPYTFQPNSARTWVVVQGSIENFLTDLWKQGALKGNKPEEAFFVHVGLGRTMTQQDIVDGRMKITIGLAVVRPAEYMLVTVSQKMDVTN